MLHGRMIMASVGYDPLAGDSAEHDLGGRVLVLGSAKECLRQAEVVLIATPDPEFQQLTIDDFVNSDGGNRRKTVIDFWRALSPMIASDERIEYIAYGRGGRDASNEDVLRGLWSESTFHGH